MYVDKELEFSDGQLITGDAISANVVDLLSVGSLTTINQGEGEPIWLVIQVATTLDSAGEAATLQVTLESDSTADLATSPTVHWDSGVLTEATLVAGYEIARVLLPAGGAQGVYERYLGIRYNNATEAFTAGAIDAFLTKDAQGNKRYYPSGFTVS